MVKLKQNINSIMNSIGQLRISQFFFNNYDEIVKLKINGLNKIKLSDQYKTNKKLSDLY